MDSIKTTVMTLLTQYRETQRYIEVLRYTFATLALQNGVDIRTVSGMLGHADPGFTLRTYTHATNPMQVQAAETVGQFMSQNL